MNANTILTGGWRVLAIAAAFAVQPLVAGAQTADVVPERAPREGFADLAEGLLDAVVNISTSQRVRSGSRGVPMPQVPEGSPFQEFFDDFFNQQQEGEGPPGRPTPRQRRVQSLGSGFVISEDGLIVTNNHVIEQADEIIANFADGTALEAEVVGRDSKTDLALLRVEPSRPLTSVDFGDSEQLRVGQWVMAIGNPFGFGGTVTVGIVSALNRDINSGPYDKFIQTDASINRGNSGGPLFDLDGKVIGINTAIISPTGGSIGIGFAVPTEIAVRVISQLREFGETRRGWLGVRIQEVTDEIAESLDMDEARGALIAGVNDDGPAAEAGIEPGDVVLSFGGIDIPSMRDLPRIVADTSVGQTAEVVLLRKGEEMTLPVTVGLLEEDEEQVAQVEEPSDDGSEDAAPETTTVMGLTLSPMTDALREEHGLGEAVNGVVVVEVEEGSIAEEKRMQAGDVIVEVGQEAVSQPEQVVKRIGELKDQGRQSALMLLSSGEGELRFVALRIEDDE